MYSGTIIGSFVIFLICLSNFYADSNQNIDDVKNTDSNHNVQKSTLEGILEDSFYNDIIHATEDKSNLKYVESIPFETICDKTMHEELLKAFNSRIKDMENNIQKRLNDIDFNNKQRIESLGSDIKSTLEDLEHKVAFKPRSGVRYKKSILKNGSSSVPAIPTSCNEVLENVEHNITGVYKIQPESSKQPFAVLCDMEIRGGGWTHIQKRFDGSQDFDLEWYDYKFGFGDLGGEFWIGLEKIYKMTASGGIKLLIEIEDRNGVVKYAHYKFFTIGSESEGYSLKILDEYSGDAGDALKYSLGQNFTTKDFDQDANSSNCAQLFSGAWWFKDCSRSYLNGKFLNMPLPTEYKYQGLRWNDFYNSQYIHAKSRMLIKPA